MLTAMNGLHWQIVQLNRHYFRRQRSNRPARVDVAFKNESGMGPGVTRGWFTSVSHAFMDPENIYLHQPGPAGFYAPRYFGESEYTSHVANTFRFLGQFVGLALLCGETIPIALNRPVIKWLCGRLPGWHDLAFYNTDRFEFLRRLLDQKDSMDWDATCLSFEVGLSSEEGGASVKLLPEGDAIQVDSSNAEFFVKLFAKYTMVDHILKPLTSMRQGLLDVLPPGYLRGWTPEELQLLLNGQQTIEFSTLRSAMELTVCCLADPRRSSQAPCNPDHASLS